MKKRLTEGMVICGGLLWAGTFDFRDLDNFQLAALYIVGLWLLTFVFKIFRSR
ncbi:MAG: hypothetical protein ABFD04_13830 [Syntrophomonas sp.]